jgi:3-phenylpropionate/cinnamic acid dioxygenase small subunit
MTDIDALAARVRRLEDVLEIQEVMARYGRCLDTHDWDGFRRLFTDDVHAEHGVVTDPVDGLDAFLATAQALSTLMEDAQHYVTNVEVDVDGDRATARAFVFAMHDVVLGDERHLVPAGGRYEDDLRRTGDGWKICRVIVHETWLDERVGKIYGR